MKRVYLVLLIYLPLMSSCQKKQIFSFDHIEFNTMTLNYLDSNYNAKDKFLVMYKNSCYGGPYYFVFKKFKEYPIHLIEYLNTNNKYLKVDNYVIPLITDSDFELYSNQGFKNDFGGYPDGSLLGSNNRFIVIMENEKGKFGRIIPKEELIEH